MLKPRLTNVKPFNEPYVRIHRIFITTIFEIFISFGLINTGFAQTRTPPQLNESQLQYIEHTTKVFSGKYYGCELNGEARDEHGSVVPVLNIEKTGDHNLSLYYFDRHKGSWTLRAELFNSDGWFGDLSFLNQKTYARDKPYYNRQAVIPFDLPEGAEIITARAHDRPEASLIYSPSGFKIDEKSIPDIHFVLAKAYTVLFLGTDKYPCPSLSTQGNSNP